MDDNRLPFLREVIPFTFLPADNLQAEAAHLGSKTIPADTQLFIQGQSRVSELLIVARGALELYYATGEDNILNDFVHEGEVFGGISLLKQGGRAIRSVRTREETLLYTLPRRRFMALCRKFPDFAEYFSTHFTQALLNRSYAEITGMQPDRSIAGPVFFDQTVSSVAHPHFLTCTPGTTLQAAARLMSEKHNSAVFIQNADGSFAGILTDRDFRVGIASGRLSPEDPVSGYMSSPLIQIEASASVFEAIMLMMQKGIKHLAIEDDNGHICGVTSNQLLLMSRGHTPVMLMRDIQQAENVGVLFGKHAAVAPLVSAFLQAGSRAENINRLITSIADATLLRIIEFALQEMGPPPARFCFMILGSEGRSEQTLKTDQDNAILFEDLPPAESKKAQDYFIALGTRISTWLDQAGYAFCNGNIMSMNPQWCQPLSVWKGYFNSWIQTPESKAVMHSSIFFDFKGAYGDLTLAAELRGYLFDLLQGRSDLFFFHLTGNALQMRPPIGFFRNFVVESKGEQRDKFDIKKAMTPIVDFARIYALSNGISSTNTLERLNDLHLAGVLTQKEHDELTTAYRYLMQIRLARQVRAIVEEKRAPDNFINPDALTNIEQRLLKEIFSVIEDFQKKLSVKFKGPGY